MRFPKLRRTKCVYFPGKGDVVHVMINFLKSLDHESWEAGIWMAAGWGQGGVCPDWADG